MCYLKTIIFLIIRITCSLSISKLLCFEYLKEKERK